MKYLGVDLGDKKVGLAISDKNGLIAFPYKLLKYTEIDSLIDEVISIIDKEEIEEVVLGAPFNMDNTKGSAYDRSLSFKTKLREKKEIKINLVDERLSSVEAEKILISTDTSRYKRKAKIDSLAAALILETYLKKGIK